jgi:site-specific DNA-methyltransferase (adenine-specific)
MFKYSWVWEKSTKTNFLNAKKQPLRKHEDVAVFCAGSCPYNPQGIVPKMSFTKQGKKETNNYGSQDRSGGGYFQENTGYPHDIIQIGSETSRSCKHPTQKPVALMEYLIRTYTNEGQTVLDNTMGSGTTGVACMNTKRNFIGIERDHDYFAIAKARIEAAQAKASEELPLHE